MAYIAEDYAYGIAHDYEWYVEGYLAKVQCQNAITLVVVSLSCIPLYSFGCVVEDIAQIKEKMNDLKNKFADSAEHHMALCRYDL